MKKIKNLSIIEKALNIAIRDLRKCYDKYGILAGRRRFDDYWARDSFFASLGCTKIGDYEIVKKNLELFLKYQKEDGQLPRRIDTSYVPLKYLGFKKKRKKLSPTYKTALKTSPSVDQNSLFIIALLDYVLGSKDYDFASKNTKKIRKAIEWNFKQDRDLDYLIEEGYLASWEDTIYRKGKILYTNALHYKAVSQASKLYEILNYESRAQFYSLLAKRIKKAINNAFWGGEYYYCWKDKKIHKEFNADGNLMAILYGIADKEKSEKIFRYMKNLPIYDPPLRNTFPRNSIWRVNIERIVTKTYGYHGLYSWIWLGCLYTDALLSCGKYGEGYKNFLEISKIIVKYDGVYEVYFKGKPIENRFISSETPFSWSSGAFISTYYNLLKFGKFAK